MADLKFGVNTNKVDSRFAETARTVERLGYDELFVPDHLGAPAPFSSVVAAALATERLRVGTYVLNAGFWNAALLAREVATADQLTGGRLTLGLGAGHMKSEFDTAGIAWEPLGRRLARLVDLVDDVDELLSDPGHVPQPVQRPRPPLLLGGTGDRLLTIAAQRADILSLGGLYQRAGRPPGEFRMISAEEADERLLFFRHHAGVRAERIELNFLVQRVTVTDDRHAAAERLSQELDGTLSAAEVLETPHVYLGTVDEIAEQITDRHKRYGFDSITVQWPSYEALAQVIAALR